MELRGTIEPALPLIVVAVHNEAEHLDTRFPILVTGIGKVAAGQAVLATLAEQPKERRPVAILNLGTAGALRHGISGTHIVGSTVQHDLDRTAIKALTGEDPSPRLVLGEGLVLATGDQFISSEKQRTALARHADLVDMEGYAVADAARLLGIPAALVKHVSDEADGSAAKSWIESVSECSRILGSWLAAVDHEVPATMVSPELDVT